MNGKQSKEYEHILDLIASFIGAHAKISTEESCVKCTSFLLMNEAVAPRQRTISLFKNISDFLASDC